ncbi:hypothetical protein Taro_014083 [Colocasia esculenta]|uniref:Uncharacterized protein n=1 Tax=Colocasia esculenta TaxID=4460 RepID=A0A843UID5_COLES|nr:hypothetical protein [Colocasia esculenta]
MLRNQPGKGQNVPRHRGRLNVVVEVELPEEGGMVEGTILIYFQSAFALVDTGAAYSFISSAFAATLPVKSVPMKSKITVASPLGSESKRTHYFLASEMTI